MDGEQPPGSGFLALVPPPRGDQPQDLLALQHRGLDMVLAANRLAVAWLQAAARQHAQVAQRVLDEMTENARRLAGASAPPETARAMLEMADRAHALGLQTAREIAALMQRMQGDTLELVDRVLKDREET